MAKDFDDFANEAFDGKYLDEANELYCKVTDSHRNGLCDASSAYYFAKQYTDEMTMLRLRQYHDWLSKSDTA